MEIRVPYINNLKTLSPVEIAEKMETEGLRQYVANAPWSEFPYKPIVAFDIAADDDCLFVNFFVRGLGLKAEFSKTNEPVWQDSCVEVFIADKDGTGYRNFEVNCIGTLLSSHQLGRGVEVEPISEHEAQNIMRVSSLPRTTFGEKEGIHQWTMLIAIPFSLLGYEKRPDSLRANFYKCADGSRWPHYVAWAPIDTPQPDFHRPEFFGKLILDPITQS